METAMTRIRPACLTIALAGFLALPLAAAAAQPGGSGSAAQMEARLRALETRVAALENRAGSAAPAVGTAMAGPTCVGLAAVGAQIPVGATLTVTVNGAVVATFDQTADVHVESFMRPGANSVALVFSAAGGPGAEAELRCQPPQPNTPRTVILRLKPTPQHLSAQAQVNLAER
jgi:hypothetical protein